MSTEWKKIDAEEYRKNIPTFVHYSSKTVNSNAALVGIRLTKEKALDLPYISLRTLLNSKHTFALEYSTGGASIGGKIIKHMNMLLEGTEDSKEASAEEIQAIRESYTQTQNTPYSVGTEYVDHRLRQILIPKEDIEGGYVSITPITASSICPLFFKAEQGLVWQHNKQVKESSDNTQKKIQQAQFGIGGSNPQNVGVLARSMQKPIFVHAPQALSSIKEAFRVYHSGIKLNVHKRGDFRDSVMAYVAFRKKVLLNEDATIGMLERIQEEKLICNIANTVLYLGNEAYELLMTHSEQLPKERALQESPLQFALISENADNKVMQALIDPYLRPKCENWAYFMAKEVVKKMCSKNAKDEQLLLLDITARSLLENIMEEVFTICNI